MSWTKKQIEESKRIEKESMDTLIKKYNKTDEDIKHLYTIHNESLVRGMNYGEERIKKNK